MWTARDSTALIRRLSSTCTHRWRHSIRHVTRIVTHTMDVNNRHGGANYRCQACTFTIKRFHNGSCAMGVSLYTDHFLTIARELGKDKFNWCYNHRNNEPYFSLFLFSESLHYWNERQLNSNLSKSIAAEIAMSCATHSMHVFWRFLNA